MDIGYYVEAQKIQRVKSHRDLGLIFDEFMTFKEQMETVKSRARKVIKSMYRFVNEVKCRATMIRLYEIFVQTILEYGWHIWIDSEHSIKIVEIEKYLWNASRYTLYTPCRLYIEGYLSYEERLSKLNKMTIRGNK